MHIIPEERDNGLLCSASLGEGVNVETGSSEGKCPGLTCSFSFRSLTKTELIFVIVFVRGRKKWCTSPFIFVNVKLPLTKNMMKTFSLTKLTLALCPYLCTDSS